MSSRLPSINNNSSIVSSFNSTGDEVATHKLFDVSASQQEEMMLQDAEYEANQYMQSAMSAVSYSEANTPKHSTRASSSRGGRIFDNTLNQMNALQFPVLDESQVMKTRIANLETTATTQCQYNTLNGQTFQNVGVHMNQMENMLKDLMNDMQTKYDAKLAALKKEYDHRFELQATENKRLQNNVAMLKADSNALKKKLTFTAEKLRKLQMEFGDPDVDNTPFFPEESALMTVSGTFSVPSSRPQTFN